MRTYKTDFAIFTNGHKIFAAINTSQAGVNELTLSMMQDLTTDNIVYQGVAGICFASVEYHSLPDHLKSIFRERLCPPAWRIVPGQAT